MNLNNDIIQFLQIEKIHHQTMSDFYKYATNRMGEDNKYFDGLAISYIQRKTVLIAIDKAIQEIKKTGVEKYIN